MGVSRPPGRPLHHISDRDRRRHFDLEDRAVAIVTDTIAYGSTYQALERPPDAFSNYSLVPRGIRRFFIDQAVTAKPVNDEYEQFLTATLPQNFAYLLRSVTWQVAIDTVSDWDNDILMRMFNSIPNQPGSTEAMGGLTTLVVPTANQVPTRTLRADSINLSMFTGPFWPTDGNAASFRITAVNVAAAVGAAGTVRSHVDFYEYDLNQAQRYYLNSPIPVMTR